ncbi:hypothetical protein JOQ06_012479, partial [Pogonophryne albipinna]
METNRNQDGEDQKPRWRRLETKMVTIRNQDEGGSLKDDVSELQTEGKSSSSEFQLSEESSTSHTLDLCIIHIDIGRSVWIICLMCSHDEEHVFTVIAMFKVTSPS